MKSSSAIWKAVKLNLHEGRKTKGKGVLPPKTRHGKILPREKALALLGNAADELVTNGKQVTDIHISPLRLSAKSWCQGSSLVF